MTTYAIGDIHGADSMLAQLLDTLDARGDVEKLWFVGDLVNRGPDSLGVLRRVRNLGDRAVVVLGNHDLSLLALACDPSRHAKAPDGLKSILAAPDCDELIDWLRHRPLAHRDTALGWMMVHAGVPAEWSPAQALTHAAELQHALRDDDASEFLKALFGNTPDRWKNKLNGIERLRYIANALTRQRFVTQNASLDMNYKKTIADAPTNLVPWFAHPKRHSLDERIVFGHWSALEAVRWPQHNVWGIDTGAAWGGPLSALALSNDPEPELIQLAP